MKIRDIFERPIDRKIIVSLELLREAKRLDLKLGYFSIFSP